MKTDDNVKTAVSKRSGFDLSFDGVLSQDWGDIVPIVCREMVPGDSFTCDASAFVRLAPLATPTYGRIHGYINYFFVPTRILLSDRKWEDFIRGGSNGKTDYILPFVPAYAVKNVLSTTSGGLPVWTTQESRRFRKLFTYLGLPDPNIFTGGTIDTGNRFEISLLPFLAYNRIYGDYFYPWGIDEDGDSTAEANYFRRTNATNFGFQPNGGYSQYISMLGRDFFLTKRACFKKDYITTAQINPQRGSTVLSRTVTYDNGVYVSPDNLPAPDEYSTLGISALGMKLANNLQKFLERNNIAGARYFEQILARFGVKIPAERLDRSEYLGGSDFYVSVSDVTATASSTDASGVTSNLGDLAGKGVGLGREGVSYKADDYGFFIATLHLMPESGVVQGIDRMWTRHTRFDYFTPEFEETGMQPLYNSEVWGDLYTRLTNLVYVEPSDTGVYGYIPRYAEYKFGRPLLAGDFRFRIDSDPSFVSFSDMDSMHLYRVFTNDDGNVPVLSPEFITLSNSAPFNRIFQDTNDDFDHFWTNIQVKLGAVRPMLGYIEASTAFVNEDASGKVNIPAFGTRL